MTDYAPPVSIQDEFLTFLLSAPSPQDIIDFHVSEMAQQRMRYLLDVNREGSISDSERRELEDVSYVNNFVMLLKAKAHLKLKSG